MFLHYITIALRNLAKYKAQTVISVVSLAVGMTVLAVIQMSEGDLTASDISPWLSVAGGIIFMLIVITLTVWSSIKGIMRLNPVEYMEKE